MLDNNEINQAVEKALEHGNWMLRRSNNGKSYNGFQWNPIGEWTEAPDWNPNNECGGGLHGNGVYTTDSFWSDYKDVDFCEIDVNSEFVYIGGENGKVKCRRARVLLRNELPDGLKHINGDLDLSKTPITKLPGGLKHIHGDLDLSETPITKLPDSLISIGGTLNLSKTKINKLPKGLASIGRDLDLRRTPITSLPKGLSIGRSLYGRLNCRRRS